MAIYVTRSGFGGNNPNELRSARALHESREKPGNGTFNTKIHVKCLTSAKRRLRRAAHFTRIYTLFGVYSIMEPPLLLKNFTCKSLKTQPISDLAAFRVYRVYINFRILCLRIEVGDLDGCFDATIKKGFEGLMVKLMDESWAPRFQKSQNSSLSSKSQKYRNILDRKSKQLSNETLSIA